MELEDLADPVPSGPAELDGARKLAHRRRDNHAKPPLDRARRSCLVAAHGVHQTRGLLAHLGRRLRRNRDALALVDAAATELSDAATEIDQAGLAIGQAEVASGAGS